MTNDTNDNRAEILRPMGHIPRATKAGRRSSWPAVCGRCCRTVDLDAVQAALRAGKSYTHDCGHVLVRAEK